MNKEDQYIQIMELVKDSLLKGYPNAKNFVICLGFTDKGILENYVHVDDEADFSEVSKLTLTMNHAISNHFDVFDNEPE